MPGLILLSLGGYLAYTIWTGNLANYINIRYAWLTQFGMAVFFLLGIVSFIDTCTGKFGGCSCSRKGPTWKMGLLIVPLLLGFGIVSRPLGANAFQDVGDAQETMMLNIGTSDVMTTENIPKPAVLYSLANDFMPDKLYSTDNQEEFTIIDWLRFYTKATDKNVMDGKPVDLIGFVTHGKSQTIGQFTVSRFFMRHCIFDTIPIGLSVDWKGSEGLKNDTWVRVRGTFSMSSGVPIIVAKSVDITDQPNPPYLYPENPAQ